MTQNLHEFEVEKPNPQTLQNAISCFADDGVERPVEKMTAAMLIIIGEACSLLDEGKTKAETIASLKQNGLSEDCSTPFVEKAMGIVASQQRAEQDGAQAMNPLLLIAGMLVVSAILVAIVLSNP
ncbi:hypothetical protein ACTSKR_12810 [Chitinibacteraceae bacterium HSL-7]